MFADRLKTSRQNAGFSQRALADLIHMKQQSYAQYESGKASPTPETIVSLARILNVSIPWLLDAEDTEFTHDEREVIKKYRALDQHGKMIVNTIIHLESERNVPEAVITPVTKRIPLIDNSFAAGIGEPDIGGRWTYVETDNDKADFAIKINGDSMEPYLPDGSIQYGSNRTPKDGEIAALLIDGEFLVKQIAIDAFGNLYLFSLNRARKDADRILWAKDDHTVSCFGTVIMRRVPLPKE